MNLSIEKILETSPYLEGYADVPIQMAFYSTGCCWWTSFPEDLGQTAPMRYDEGKHTVVSDRKGHRLPCCPHCSSLLLQAPLRNFIEQAKGQVEHYGPSGVDAFIVSHERNCRICFTHWKNYDLFLDIGRVIK